MPAHVRVRVPESLGSERLRHCVAVGGLALGTCAWAWTWTRDLGLGTRDSTAQPTIYHHVPYHADRRALCDSVPSVPSRECYPHHHHHQHHHHRHTCANQTALIAGYIPAMVLGASHGVGVGGDRFCLVPVALASLQRGWACDARTQALISIRHRHSQSATTIRVQVHV